MQIKRQIFSKYEYFKKWFEEQKRQYLIVEEPENLLWGVAFIDKVPQIGLLQSKDWRNNQEVWGRLKSKAIELDFEVQKIIASLQNPFKERLKKESDIPRIPVPDGMMLSFFNSNSPLSRKPLTATDEENVIMIKRSLIDYLKIKTMRDKVKFWSNLLDKVIEGLIKEEKKIEKVLPNCAFFLRAEDIIPSINPSKMKVALVGYRLFFAIGT